MKLSLFSLCKLWEVQYFSGLLWTLRELHFHRYFSSHFHVLLHFLCFTSCSLPPTTAKTTPAKTNRVATYFPPFFSSPQFFSQSLWNSNFFFLILWRNFYFSFSHWVHHLILPSNSSETIKFSFITESDSFRDRNSWNKFPCCYLQVLNSILFSYFCSYDII